ncbi:type VI secretion system protein ImpL [Desulfonauticus submarinus]|uniref:Type VI secretion system protein ImpL n=1 Tax=Desulfonauticus submarinus TaxID=206665 RepID=A0A1G9ZU02_9BACT|nr:type VI secretion protein IcmF/TssM N-terminal domain-containing protein [Desulfonauticus submarinus]SDN24585.1 type VI secretion system protein ImpL [Desulfonauticus submarinus]
MKTIWKILGFIVVVACLLGILVIGWLEEWSWWLIGAVCFVFIGGIVAVIFIKRYIARRKERLFVKRVIEQDSKIIEESPEHSRVDLEEMQAKWKEAISLLSKSHLKKYGNPLYVLPWFLFLGESGSGKSTALKNSRLASPLTDIPKVSGIAGTRNFDWWFFEKAIILDTAGRYSIPIDEIQDKEEWENFLTLIAKYRKKEPLNGIVVSISCEDLLKDDNAKLTDKGQFLRKRIDQVMRVTGYKIPIYLLVTKVDKIHGFIEFVSALGDKYYNQCLGYMVKEDKLDWRGVLKESLTYIGDKLRKFRFLIVQQSRGVNPALLLFPKELERLSPGLEAFCEGLLSPNPYQEEPFFRGIYFSSAKQEGEILSDFLTNFSLTKFAVIKNFIKERGLFLRDFFASILPSDRYLFMPLREYQTWKKRTFTIAFVAWILLVSGTIGLILGAYNHNLSILTKIKDISKISFKEDINSNLILLSKYGELIQDLESENNDYPLPMMGFSYSHNAIDKLKNIYVEVFKDKILEPIDNNIVISLRTLLISDKENNSLRIIDFILNQVVLLEYFIKKDDKNTNNMLSNLSYDLPLVYNRVKEEISPYFSKGYNLYLGFSSKKYLGSRLEFRLNLLKEILSSVGRDLHWVIYHPDLNQYNISLSRLWEYTNNFENDSFVPGAFTVKGKKYIDNFISFLKTALNKKGVLTPEVERSFFKWYKEQFFEEWRKFLQNFSDGEMALENWSSRHEMAMKMCSEDNPYYGVIELFVKQVQGVFGKDKKTLQKDIPTWVKPILILYSAWQEAQSLDQKKSQSLPLKEKLKRKILGDFFKFKKTALSLTNDKELKRYQDILKIAKLWLKYKQDMQKLVHITTDSATAFQLTSEFFPYGTNPTASKSVFYIVNNDIFSLKVLLKKYGDNSIANYLLAAPFKYVVDYAIMETACVLQQKWEEEVLGKIEGLNHIEKIKLLFNGENSLVDKFLQNTAKPFVGLDRFGYYPRKALGKKLPFTKSFFGFVNQGKNLFFTSKKTFEVYFRTLPVGANKDAKIQPYGCKLSLQCAEKIYELENFNFPSSETFKWSSDQCGDVTLWIYLPGLKLKKVFSGPLGLAKFLLRFRDGSSTFYPKEFGSDKEFLQSQKIKWIKVGYEIQGAEPIIKMLQDIPDEIPTEILTCWH